MYRPRLFPASIFVLGIALSSSADGQERFDSPTAGIALNRPAGWHTATLAQVQTNRERARLSDPEWQAALATRSAMPLIVFTKYAEPHAGLNPSVQVTLRPALAGTPGRLLSTAIEQMRHALFDFRIVSPVHPVQVGRWPAAQVEVTYTLKNQAGDSFGVRSRLWLVPRGPLMFLIGMSGAQTGADVCAEEFAAALDSIDIQK
jgi:hypothetical protein